MSVLVAMAVPHPPLIIPEVGRGQEEKIKSTVDAYREVMKRAADLKPDTIVLMTPHSIMYSDYIHISPGQQANGDMSAFRAPSVKISAEYDTEYVSTLCRLAKQRMLPAGTSGERDASLDHASLIPLYFLNECLKEYKLVRIGLSGMTPLTHYQLGKCISDAADELDRRVVVIGSGDLSHKLLDSGPYGYASEGPEFDSRITKDFANGDFLDMMCMEPDFTEAAAECGLRSFLIMAGALDGKAVTHELLSYEGPFGVGYGVAWFGVSGNDKSRCFDIRYEEIQRKALEDRKADEDMYVRLARHSIETYVNTGKPAEMPAGLPDELTGCRAGAFVSLKENGVLRGCIGTIKPTAKSIAQEIMRNAVSACSEDPRFEPVSKDELPYLVYSVDILGAPEIIFSEKELNVKRYGVIVENGHRRGLLLPDLEGVDTVDRQLSIARKKAGILPGESVTMYRFEVIRHV